MRVAHGGSIIYSKSTYLIDTENVGISWKQLLPIRSSKDRIILFYTEKSPFISYPDFVEVLQYAGTFETMKCVTGKNALDFQLVTYLGYLLKTAVKTDYVIVSNDSGYDAVCQFWREIDENYSVVRKSPDDLLKPKELPVSETSKNAAKKAKRKAAAPELPVESTTLTEGEPLVPSAEELAAKEAQIRELLTDYYAANPSESGIEKELLTLFDQWTDKTSLQELHVLLVRTFKNAKGSELYRILKPNINTLN